MKISAGYNFVSEQSKALIRLGTDCNNNCVFCHSSGVSGVSRLENEAVLEKIRLAGKSGVGMVVFSGGEPTIRKELPEFFEEVRSLGMEAGLITNGRMFYYKEFVDKIVDAGLKYALVSLHGSKAEIHNRMTGAVSFDQTIKGLKNISSRGVKLVVNTVLTRHNAADLSKIHSLLNIFSPVHHKISLPEPKGAALDNFRIVMPPDNAAGAAAALLQGIESTDGVTIGFDGFTPCLLNGYFSLKDDFYTHGFYLVSEPWEKEYFKPTHGNRAFHSECLYCSLYHLCPGIYAQYFEEFPSFVPEPLTRPVSNNVRFDLVDSETIAGGDDECKLKSIRKTDPVRWIVVKNQKEIKFFNTDEIQTDSAELSKIKFGLEQVYAQSGVPESNKNIPEHLKKLSLDEKCRNCGDMSVCPGVFVESENQPFELLEKRMKEILDSVSGRTLEIGFGSGPYFEDIKRGMAEGRISFYVGIEPEPLIGEISDIGSNSTIIRTSVEDFEWDGELFDTILLLRSYHHLQDLKHCMEKISAMLKDGGKIIITEDYKHAEITDSDRKDNNAAGRTFEHFRNHSETDVMEVLSKCGFVKEFIYAVGKDTPGHWIVSAVKRELD